MGRIKVSWHDEVVGFIDEPASDMWYLEGRWVPSEGQMTTEFLHVAQDLNLERCMREGDGLVVELAEENGKPIMGLVMSAPGETIFVRQVFDERAKEMLREREKNRPRKGTI